MLISSEAMQGSTDVVVGEIWLGIRQPDLQIWNKRRICDLYRAFWIMLISFTRPPPKVLLTARTKVKDEPRVTDGLNVGAHHVLVNRISPDFQIWNKRRILHLPCPWWVGCEILPSAHPHLPYLWTRRNNGQGGGRRAPWYLTCSSKL